MSALMANRPSTQSVFIPPTARPIAHRQRSNSVPILAFSLQDASLLISTAEKASARRSRHRRGPQSIDGNASGTENPRDRSRYPPPTSTMRSYRRTSNLSPPNDDSNDISGKPLPAAPRLTALSPPAPTPPPKSAETTAATHACGHKRQRSRTLDSPPTPRKPSMPPSSASTGTTPRRVSSRQLKDYADGLFLFTQSRMNTSVPYIPSNLLPLLPSVQLNESPIRTTRTPSNVHHVPLAQLRLPRPDLASHFSDWSVEPSSAESPESPFPPHFPPSSIPITSELASSPPIPLTPDSFFQLHLAPTPSTIIGPTGPTSHPNTYQPQTQPPRQPYHTSTPPLPALSFNTRASSPTYIDFDFDSAATSSNFNTPASSELATPAVTFGGSVSEGSYFAGFDGVTAAAERALDSLVLDLGTPPTYLDQPNLHTPGQIGLGLTTSSGVAVPPLRPPTAATAAAAAAAATISVPGMPLRATSRGRRMWSGTRSRSGSAGPRRVALVRCASSGGRGPSVGAGEGAKGRVHGVGARDVAKRESGWLSASMVGAAG